MSSCPSTLIVKLCPSSTISLICVEVNIFIPFFSSSFLSTAEDSLSTPGTILSIISTTVTSLPNDKNTCPSSIPTTPPPITASDLGICCKSKISSLVSTLLLSIPGILIFPTFDPPAKIILSALKTVSPFTTTSLSLLIFPTPLNILISLLFRSPLTPFVNVLTISFFNCTTFGMSIVYFSLSKIIPLLLAISIPSRISAFLRNVFVGIHPLFRQVPPNSFFSTTATFAPS